MSRVSRTTRIICVDRRQDLYHQIERVFSKDDHVVCLESSVARVLERFEREPFDVLIFSSVAAKGTEIDGVELLDVISAKSPATQILLLVKPSEIKMVMSALRAGTYQYSKLPVSDEELGLLIEAAIQQRAAHGPNGVVKEEHRKSTFESMVGISPSMQEMFRRIRQAAATDIPVLLFGETGTGKDVAAEAIHRLGPRRDGPYIPVHLGALPPELVAGELFGHEKGAFTGALSRHIGSFEQADGGTVFLDEVSTMDEKVQISLLRLIESREYYRIGGRHVVSADVRVIAASNEDLWALVRRGVFREDLFYRLDVFHIVMPPLRHRQGDMALLIDHFLEQFNRSYGKRIIGISPACVARLESYEWPGNVRELKNVVQRAVVMCQGDVLLPEHLPQRLRSEPTARPSVSFKIGATLAEIEREIVARTLAFTGNNRKKAAALLGISRRALYNKIAKYGLKGTSVKAKNRTSGAGNP